MRRRSVGHALEYGVPILVVVGVAVMTARSSNYFFPPLTRVLEAFVSTWLGEGLLRDAVPSLIRMSAGFAVAVVLGVLLGILLGTVEPLRRAADPIVEFARSIPPPALLPFAMLVLGIGDTMKIAIIALVCLFPVLLNTINGIQGIDPTLHGTAASYRIGRWDRMTKIVLPASGPQIFAGMRTSLTLAIIMMVVSEMVASTNGIGYSVLQAQRTFAITDMWAGIILIGLVGILLNGLLLLVERRVLRWHRGAMSSGPE